MFLKFSFFCVRDEGMLFPISKWQWIIEVAQMLINLVFIAFFYSKRIEADRAIILFNTMICVIIYPAFFLLGDFQFRRRIRENGFFIALKHELLEH